MVNLFLWTTHPMVLADEASSPENSDGKFGALRKNWRLLFLWLCEPFLCRMYDMLPVCWYQYITVWVTANASRDVVLRYCSSQSSHQLLKLQNCAKNPVLSGVALDVLAVSASSVPSEREFFKAGTDVRNPHRLSARLIACIWCHHAQRIGKSVSDSHEIRRENRFESFIMVQQFMKCKSGQGHIPGWERISFPFLFFETYGLLLV